MTTSEAMIILDIIECATDSNWPNTASGLGEMGYTGIEIVAATKTLAELGHRSNPFHIDDF